MYIKTIILICVHTKTSKFHKPSLGQDLKNFMLVSNTEFLKKKPDGSRTPTTSETLPPVTLAKRLKTV